jgi:hypothetical protein
MKFYNEAVLTNTYNVVSSETINDGTFTVLVSRSDTPNSRIYTCELKGTEYGICDCDNFQMYNMVCMHLVNAYRYLKHIGYLKKVDSQTWVKQMFPKCMVMDHVNSNVLTLDFVSYVSKPLNETITFANEQQIMLAPPVYTTKKPRSVDNCISSIGESGRSSNTNHPINFVLDKRITYQSEKTRVSYFNKNSLNFLDI